MTDALDPLTLPLSGTSLIEASAGTGKTHAIATLFLRLLLERELAVDEILVVTFTEAAALSASSERVSFQSPNSRMPGVSMTRVESESR